MRLRILLPVYHRATRESCRTKGTLLSAMAAEQQWATCALLNSEKLLPTTLATTFVAYACSPAFVPIVQACFAWQGSPRVDLDLVTPAPLDSTRLAFRVRWTCAVCVDLIGHDRRPWLVAFAQCRVLGLESNHITCTSHYELCCVSATCTTFLYFGSITPARVVCLPDTTHRAVS